MCKPVVQHIPVRTDGPCGFNFTSHSDACTAFWTGTTVRERAANVLRRWADKISGQRTFTVSGYAPSQITFDDVIEAASMGFTQGSKYLNDLWRDRSVGDTKVVPMFALQSKPVK